MTKLVLAVVLATNFTTYNFDGGPLPRIEAVTDRGPILELIVHCQSGTAIITYSKSISASAGLQTSIVKSAMNSVISRMRSGWSYHA